MHSILFPTAMHKRPRCGDSKRLPYERQRQAQRHYYADGAWRTSSLRESCYSDFAPCTYDERTFISRLYKYALTLFAQTNGSALQRSPFSITSGSSNHSDEDFEMITSSPSPTLHARTASTSPGAGLHPVSRHGSYRFSSGKSPRPHIKPPSPAAFPRYPPQLQSAAPNPHKRPLSTSSQSTNPSTNETVDVGTQYSPPLVGVPSMASPLHSSGKRRGLSKSPELPAEPTLAPQKPFKPTYSSSSIPQAAAAPPTTLAKSSSSSSQGSSPKRARPHKLPVKHMPAQYETCDVKDLVVLISNMLMELVRFNDDIPLKDGRLTRFHSRAPPGISVKDYLQRLATHATLSPPILLSMVYYIDRLCALYPAFTISSLTVHRFLITSATVASKGLSDSFWTNNTYARVGGVSLKELALLELEFLWRVEWRIVPKPEVLVDYYRSLIERSEGFKIEGSPVSEKSSSLGEGDLSERVEQTKFAKDETNG